MSSRSSKGTRTTRSFIAKDSAKRVDRTAQYQEKRGTRGSTDSAHIFGWGLMNVIETNSAGRPLSSATRAELARDMNHPTNMRLKSTYGNKTLDERRDARIASAYVNGTALHGTSTATRVFQAFRSASTFTTLDKYAVALGNLKIENPDTGRLHYVRNHGKYM